MQTGGQHDAIGWSVAIQKGGQVECNFPLSKEFDFPRIKSGLFMKNGQRALDDAYDWRSRRIVSVIASAFVSSVSKAPIALAVTLPTHSLRATWSLLQCPQRGRAGCAGAV